jgi:hypothetical protein
MRQLIAALLTAGLMMALVTPAAAQGKATTTPSKLQTRTVIGTVQSTTADAIVVRGMEKAKEREWAFSVDDKTTVLKGGQHASAATLKAGDRVPSPHARARADRSSQLWSDRWSAAWALCSTIPGTDVLRRESDSELRNRV